MSLVTARLDVVQNVSDELLGLGCQVEVSRRFYWFARWESSLLRYVPYRR